MAEYILKRKFFTKWDDTDNLKRMKDSDILAEKKRKTTNYGSIAGTAAVGAAAGAGAGGIIGVVRGGSGNTWLSRRGRGLARGGKTGAVLGGLGAGYIAYRRGKKEADKNRFYNERLEYAQRQARRRERKDWKNNMTNRDGYSY